MVVLRVLAAVGLKLSNMQVRWFSDNRNVVKILQFGSKRVHLQAVAMKVFFVSLPGKARARVGT